ncbi:MAG: ABC transporter substrate-binding protein [Deltaproteobacteria bacterium]|jgi:polar amino acid transport system substrate-binding protein|nr:ABC transporter substrate-binding protein [Deltaproteobacteria bacterium]
MFKQNLLLLLISFFLFGGTALAAQKTYINGIDANYPPHAYVGKSGQPEGFDVEALDWIALKMGFQVKHQPMDWDAIVASLLAKKIDMVCSGMSITPERQAVVNFSAPYFSVRKVLLVNADKPLSKEEILKGNKILGVQRGTNEAEWLVQNREANGWNYTLRYYDSAPLAIEDLVNRRPDAVAVDSAPANDAIKKGGKDVRIVGEFAEADDFGVAVRKEDEELLRLINEGFKLLMQDPFWQKLQDKYDTQL